MFKPLIAGIAALSLTFATMTPAQANGLDRDDVGKIIIGLAALAALNAAIENNSSSQNEPAAANHRRSWADLNQPRARRAALPRNCLRTIETRNGNQRIFGRRCLESNYAQVDRLPNRCAVRILSTNGPRRGFDPLCLREQGYRTNRRH